MTALFTLKASNPKNLCETTRCTDNPTRETFGDLWGKSEVKLCDKHFAMALAFAEKYPDYKPETKPTTALAKVSSSEMLLPPTWAERAQEIVAIITESKTDADNVLKVIDSIVISNQSDLDDVTSDLRDVVTKRSVHERMEKEITTPLNTVIKKVREMLGPAKESWSKAEELLRLKISQFKLIEAQRNNTLMQEAAAKHEAGGDVTATLGQMTTSTDLNGVSGSIVWVAIVEDARALAKERLDLVKVEGDPRALKAYAASFKGAEPAALPGVRFVQNAPLRVTKKPD